MEGTALALMNASKVQKVEERPPHLRENATDSEELRTTKREEWDEYQRLLVTYSNNDVPWGDAPVAQKALEKQTMQARLWPNVVKWARDHEELFCHVPPTLEEQEVELENVVKSMVELGKDFDNEYIRGKDCAFEKWGFIPPPKCVLGSKVYYKYLATRAVMFIHDKHTWETVENAEIASLMLRFWPTLDLVEGDLYALLNQIAAWRNLLKVEVAIETIVVACRSNETFDTMCNEWFRYTTIEKFIKAQKA